MLSPPGDVLFFRVSFSAFSGRGGVAERMNETDRAIFARFAKTGVGLSEKCRSSLPNSTARFVAVRKWRRVTGSNANQCRARDCLVKGWRSETSV